MSIVFDVLLAVLVLAVVGRMLLAADLFEATALFVAFGLSMSLVWVRLGAVDVALAEAALGAGVTGALLVNTLRRLERKAPRWLEPLPHPRGTLPVALACGGAAAAAGVLAIRSPRAVLPLGERIVERVADAAVMHPVTAVLLDFRAYDTLLEIAVLVASVAAVWSLERGRPAVPPSTTIEAEPVLGSIVRRIVPLIVITTVYMLWIGSYAPGGAFQAGALLAGAAVLLLAAGFVRPYAPGSVVLRGAVAAGLLVFSAVALLTAWMHGAMLRYPAESGGLWVLGIEAVLTVSIAAMLADLFVDVPAAPPDRVG